jgi:hypothetical protein
MNFIDPIATGHGWTRVAPGRTGRIIRTDPRVLRNLRLHQRPVERKASGNYDGGTSVTRTVKVKAVTSDIDQFAWWWVWRLRGHSAHSQEENRVPAPVSFCVHESMIRRALLGICLVALSGCGKRSVPTPALPAAAAIPNDYVDLEAGWRLRALIPLLKSGGFRPTMTEQQTVISLNIRGDFIGYETAYYMITPQRQAGVWIQFQSAVVTKDGNTVPEQQAPPSLSMPPRKMKYARLIYLVRVSQTDHDMALIASRRKEILNASTRRVQSDPVACRSDDTVFCTWIPAGIAVRPERQPSVDSTWVPAH